MKKVIQSFLILIAVLVCSNNANALEIHYPENSIYKTQAKETYILGNVHRKSMLYINGEKIKIYKGGIFCHVVPLKTGENNFVITEKNKKCSQTQVYTVIKSIVPSKSIQKKQKPKEKIFNEKLFATVTKDGTPVRSGPSENAERITHLPLNTVVLPKSEFCGWYNLETGEKQNLWINKNDVKVLYSVKDKLFTDIKNVCFSQDENFSYMKLQLDMPVMFKIQEDNNSLRLTIFGVKDISQLANCLSEQKIFNNAKIDYFENNNLTVLIPTVKQLWGYEATYHNNTLIFTKRKTPSINPAKPLENITVAIDPGHGGSELGTRGPAYIPEKDVNLAISLKLKKELEKNGANVILTRDTDKFTGLYERPKIAKENNALICLSIHANSILDGNPYEKHGVSVFYYNKQAKNLANSIKTAMINDLDLKDDGTNFASFVLTRPTMPISVLVEVAYMPNPDEYLILTDKRFQKRVAKSISNGLKNFLLHSAK